MLTGGVLAPGAAPEDLATGAGSDTSLLRQWKRWETGEHVPSDFYQPLIAATFGTATHAIFPVEGRREANSELLSAPAWTRWSWYTLADFGR